MQFGTFKWIFIRSNCYILENKISRHCISCFIYFFS
uniref:Uncharacterized protein n=1 Tax=Podoviridae sp. ct8Lf7 TaxID=2827723 RepID=A0A8S5S0B1_9CAUD|nr:MAG TPA: hypothetical protein [Podoviridae sp. ct8Lf7]